MKVLNRLLPFSICLLQKTAHSSSMPHVAPLLRHILPEGAQIYGPFPDEAGALALHKQRQTDAHLAGDMKPCEGILLSAPDLSVQSAFFNSDLAIGAPQRATRVPPKLIKMKGPYRGRKRTWPAGQVEFEKRDISNEYEDGGKGEMKGRVEVGEKILDQPQEKKNPAPFGGR